MQRYFVSPNQIEDNKITITGEDVHHIAHVMRMKVMDKIICCVNGKTAHCTITEISDTVCCEVMEWMESHTELPVQVMIASGLPKGDKLEQVIQKGTELGACSFIPLKVSRSIIKWDDKKGDKKVERWQKIAKEAAEQSYRAIVPNVEQPQTIKQLIQFAKDINYKLVAYEQEAKQGEKSNFARFLTHIQPSESVLIVFGSEGGLDMKEVAELQANGFIPCSLGPRILRTETAPLYALAAISYEMELRR